MIQAIFVSMDGYLELPLSQYLGNHTDEIGDGDYITEFRAQANQRQILQLVVKLKKQKFQFP